MPQDSREYFAHETACIDQPCSIGEGTRIWHFSHVMKGAQIGRRCTIGQNVFVGAKALVGDRVKIQNNVSVYDRVTLEEGVFCGPSMVFTNVMNPRAEIERKDEFRPIVVRRGATLGANCTIVCGHTIGEYAFVAAGAAVTSDVPPFTLVAGVPAKPIGWVSRTGDRLHFDENGLARCPNTGKMYCLENGRVRELDETADPPPGARQE